MVWPHKELWGDRDKRREVRDYLKRIWEENNGTVPSEPSMQNTRIEKNDILQASCWLFMTSFCQIQHYFSGGGRNITLGKKRTSQIRTLEDGCTSSMVKPPSSPEKTIVWWEGIERSRRRDTRRDTAMLD